MIRNPLISGQTYQLNQKNELVCEKRSFIYSGSKQFKLQSIMNLLYVSFTPQNSLWNTLNTIFGVLQKLRLDLLTEPSIIILLFTTLIASFIHSTAIQYNNAYSK